MSKPSIFGHEHFVGRNNHIITAFIEQRLTMVAEGKEQTKEFMLRERGTNEMEPTVLSRHHEISTFWMKVPSDCVGSQRVDMRTQTKKRKIKPNRWRTKCENEESKYIPELILPRQKDGLRTHHLKSKTGIEMDQKEGSDTNNNEQDGTLWCLEHRGGARRRRSPARSCQGPAGTPTTPTITRRRERKETKESNKDRGYALKKELPFHPLEYHQLDKARKEIGGKETGTEKRSRATSIVMQIHQPVHPI